MAVTPVAAVGLSRNRAFDTSLGTLVDITNFNSFANNGRTILVIQTGATPGTVSVVVSRKVDGKTVSDVVILDSAGAALAANKVYLCGVGGAADYGDIVTIKASNALTKVMVFQQ